MNFYSLKMIYKKYKFSMNTQKLNGLEFLKISIIIFKLNDKIKSLGKIYLCCLVNF